MQDEYDQNCWFCKHLGYCDSYCGSSGYKRNYSPAFFRILFARIKRKLLRME